jgi:hypothetical protein
MNLPLPVGNSHALVGTNPRSTVVFESIPLTPYRDTVKAASGLALSIGFEHHRLLWVPRRGFIDRPPAYSHLTAPMFFSLSFFLRLTGEALLP